MSFEKEWVKATIITRPEGIEPVSGILYLRGITGLEIEDRKDLDEFLEESKGQWDYVDDKLLRQFDHETYVTFYTTDNPSGREVFLSIKAAIEELKKNDSEDLFGSLDIRTDNINEEDWANNWKKYFKPIPVGEKIMIQPEWQELSEKTERIVFKVNPGMAFGTGGHETTRLCIEKLEKYIFPGCSVLDLGCGSGILSVIALMLGAESAVAVDIDPNVKEIVYNNLNLNEVDDKKIDVFIGDIISDDKLQKEIASKKYDVIIANIVADVIINLCNIVNVFMKKDIVYICSGIIQERISEVEKAITNSGLKIISVDRDGEWAAIVCAASE